MMSQQVSLDVLRNLRFLKGLAEEDLEHIASVSQLEEFPAGKLIFRQGQQMTKVFLVVEGAIGLEMRVASRTWPNASTSSAPARSSAGHRFLARRQ
jgi:hypothetical protein